MHKKIRFIPFLSVLLTVGLLSLSLSGCGTRSDSVAVDTAVASSQKIDLDVELSGVLLPAQTVDVSSRVSGQVASLGFTVGSRVKKGDVLVTLNSEAIQGQLMQARASLHSAEAGARTAANQVEIAKIDLEAAQRAYDRNQSLFESGAVSQSQWEKVQDDLNTAQKRYETASGSALEQAQAAIETARANVQNFSLQLDEASIESPLDGILASQNIDVGEVLSPGAAVISLVDTSTLKLKTTIAQENLAYLKAGQELEVTVDAYPELKLKGSVSSVGPVAVSTGEVFPVEISVKNDQSLMAGLSAHAVLKTAARGITVPASALLKTSGENYVFVVKDQAAYKRPVQTGLKSRQDLIVLSGLAEGETVAVTNVNALADRCRVEVRQ